MSNLDFNNTKSFRDALLSKTLQAPNGPQTFSSTSYSVQNTNSFSNTDSGDVVINDVYDRSNLLKNSYAINRFGPENADKFVIIDDITTIPSLGNLALYPYFITQDVLGRSLIGALNSENYEFESKLAQFSNRFLSDDPQGPVQARIRQNLETATLGRLRILDAINGNTSTAINIIRGRESLVEKNYKITVASSIPGKIIDFVQTVAGVEFPFSEIPGDYLSNPANPVVNRPVPKTQFGAILQDVTGVLGSLVGIKRRPKLSSKPSDIMYEYMGSGQKQNLHDNLSFSTYKPDYTTTARSQQSSKLFNFPGAIAQGIKNVLGVEAPKGNAYIGDDRSENAIYATSDFNGNIVKSPYYLSLLFDPIQARYFQNERNISERGEISGKLTWYSKNSKNKLGANNKEYNSERSKLEGSLSTKTAFREDSILAKTQELLNSMPLDGAQSRSHVGNAIDQTSRIFKEGDMFFSRGSAIKYVNATTGKEDGTEYCRVWTKDRAYMNYSDTMKRTGLIRKVEESVISTPWNLNIAPMSDGQRGFKNSTNIEQTSDDPIVGKAKKYMFSIENLAWKTSNKPGFTVEDLPVCERGSNGGRVMWFPPYDLKVNEVSTANWDSNKFIGRPEPIYTYQNTERTGTVSFKVIVDHPSILNLLIKDISDEESENYLNAFFAGCHEVDFYTLVRKYTTLTRTDLELVKAYLEYYRDGITGDTTEALSFKSVAGEQTLDKGVEIGGKEGAPGTSTEPFKGDLYFPNDFPAPNTDLYANQDYAEIYNDYIAGKPTFLSTLDSELTKILTVNTANNKFDRVSIFGSENPTTVGNAGYTNTQLIDQKKTEINEGFSKLTTSFNDLNSKLAKYKELIGKNQMKEITIDLTSTTSFVADDKYNIKLSYRRSDSIFKHIIKSLSKNNSFPSEPKEKGYWKKTIAELNSNPAEVKEDGIVIPFKNLGYGEDIKGEVRLKFTNKGENAKTNGGLYDCSNVEIKNTGGLKKVAPITFFCRSTNVDIVALTNATEAEPPTRTPDVTTISPGKTDIVYDKTTKNRRPPLDAVKKIIMKTLSECFYFKKLEEKDPVVFGSLKDKLKYFHPAFHSMTPEGLNSRLTFLQQCVRPGDTIPIKGLGRETDISNEARNTSFGPPPICVLRVGDFYHSKIIIGNVNISFENSTWDINPEGIGMQPMIADVTLQITFIGGQGLKEPVARLQNALSSNFYANTEIYDYRAEATSDKDGIKNMIKYRKDFLESFFPKETPKTPTSESSADTPIDGKYIGTPKETKLSYNENIDEIIKNTNGYFKVFGEVYNELQKTFGAEMLPLFISPLYRTNNKLDVQETSSASIQIELLGKYKMGYDFTNMITDFEKAILEKVDLTDHNLLFDLDIQSGTSKYDRSRKIIDPFIKTQVTEYLALVRADKKINAVEEARDKFINEIDKINFIILTAGVDAKTDKGVVTAQKLTNFDNNKMFEKYEKAIDLFKNKHVMFTEDLNTTFDFKSTSITDEQYKKLIAFIIKDKVEKIKTTYASSVDKDLFDNNTNKKIERRLDRFVSDNLTETKDKKFKFKEAITKKTLEPYDFTPETLDSAKEEIIKKIHNNKDSSTSEKLNFSKAIK
jgi:outer membrane protein OmpA-like peptidoglycan-associated protein